MKKATSLLLVVTILFTTLAMSFTAVTVNDPSIFTMKELAGVGDEPTYPPTEPTFPPTEPTYPPTEPTFPPTDPPTVAPTRVPTVPPTAPVTQPPTETPTPEPTMPPTVAPTQVPTIPETYPPTQAPVTQPPTVSDTAVITIYGLYGQSVTREFKRGDIFFVYTTLDASNIASGGMISCISGKQAYSTDNLMPINLSKNEMFPILNRDNGVVSNSYSGYIMYTATTPNIDDAFAFDTPDDCVIVTMYYVSNGGTGYIRNYINTMAKADDMLTPIVKDGEVVSSEPINMKALYEKPIVPTQPPTLAPTEPPTEPPTDEPTTPPTVEPTIAPPTEAPPTAPRTEVPTEPETTPPPTYPPTQPPTETPEPPTEEPNQPPSRPPVYPTEPPEPPTELPATEPETMPPGYSDKIIIDADGNKYEVEAGTTHTYSFYLNNGGKVCSLDSTTLWDTSGIIVYADAISFPLIASDALFVNNDHISTGKLTYNYSNPNGEDFDVDDSILITFTFKVKENARPGIYKIRTNIKTLAGEDEQKQIFSGVDRIDFYRKEGVLDGEEPFNATRAYVVEKVTYIKESGEDKDFVVKAKNGDDTRTVENFTGFTVDGTAISERYFELYVGMCGELIITLKSEYLELLEPLEHMVQFTFVDGSVTTSLYIISPPTVGPTIVQNPTTPYEYPTYPYETPTEHHYPHHGNSIIYFDASTAGWSGATILFYIYDLTAGQELAAWGSKKLAGTADGDIYAFDPYTIGLENGKQYYIIFNNKDTTAETYPLLFDSTCLGDTAYCTGNRIENPVDSNKSSLEAVWSNSSFGPRLAITSVGHVVGRTCPANTTKYDMFLHFLTSTGRDGINNAMNFNPGRTREEVINSVAAGLGLTEEEKNRALVAAGLVVPTQPPTQPPVDSYGYTVGAYYLTGNISGDNSGISAVHKELKFVNQTSDQMILENVKLKEGDVVRVARYNGGNTFTVYPDGIGRDITISSSGRYDFYFKPYEMGNANYWYITPSYKGIDAFILGDIDGDEEVTSIDATYLLRYNAEIDTGLDMDILMRGDVDGNGELEIVDATYIQRWLAEFNIPYDIGELTTA